jgi:spermidine synthase
MGKWRYLIFLQKAFSYFFPLLIEQRKDGISSYLEVWLVDGGYQLNTKKANYSFGSLHVVFATVFKKHQIQKKPIKDVLILGFGVGSVASILQDEYKINCQITGIDLDPVVMELGQKYFNTARFKNSEIILSDALKFIERNQKKFDFIVVDLFIDLTVPENFSKLNFIEHLGKSVSKDGILFFNIVPQTQKSLETALLLEMNLKKIFRSVSTEKLTIYNTGNWVFVCQNALM